MFHLIIARSIPDLWTGNNKLFRSYSKNRYSVLRNTMTSLFYFVLLLLSSFSTRAVLAEDNLTAVLSNTSLNIGPVITKPGCPSKCGNLTVPYPFGLGADTGCSIDPVFDIICNTSFDPPKVLLAFNEELEILDITETKFTIRNKIAYDCYKRGAYTNGNSTSDIDLTGSPFSFSNANKLTVVGCDDICITTVEQDELSPYISSCVAICSRIKDLVNGSCTGIGCCEASIPKGLQYIHSMMYTWKSHQGVDTFNPCGYSFLAEENSYVFSVNDVSDTSFINRTLENVPIAIEWEIGNRGCNSTSKNTCQRNSVCVDSDSTLGGIRCNCTEGYEGNPYLSPGCKDINECLYNPCDSRALCINLPGSYNCSCPAHYLGDGTIYGTACIYVPPPKKVALYAGLSSGFGLFLLLAISFWLYKVVKRRRSDQFKQSNFKRNGGLLLQQEQSAVDDHVLEKMRIFTAKELEKATDKFSQDRVLGQGAHGMVFKGMISDGRIVAVKKSKLVNENQLQQFINEVVILSQINHRNVVKLLGCCLETEVPLLVYEFIPNGTLYDLIHDESAAFPLTWDLRLRIAVEIANALAYLHNATSVPIYHRDMKSNNILLDEKFRAKLSDFGISRSVSTDQTHLTTNVKGTIGYMDPEYFQTGKFTEKSDVYSFGVVLVELLTVKKPISTNDSDEEKSLVTRFLVSLKENGLKAILDPRIMEQGVREEHVAVSDLAKRCLGLNGKKRPSIREVAMELESIRTCDNPSYVESNGQDVSYVRSEIMDLPDDGELWAELIGCEANGTETIS